MLGLPRDVHAFDRGRLGSPWSVQRTSPAPVADEPPRPRMIRGQGDPSAADGSDPRRREAARAFADGEAAFDRGDYDDAAERFGRAHALSPHPWTLYNHAVSLRQAGRAVEAWRAFAELEAISQTDDERAEARREQAALRGRIAVVELRGAADAPVCIDHELVRLGPDGHARWVGTPGTHRLWSAASPRTFTVVEGDSTRIEVRPAKPRAPKSRGWLVTAIVGSSLGLGGAAAGAAIADDRRVQAVAGTAAVASAAALVASIVVLARTERAAKRVVPAPLPCELVSR